MCCCKIVKDYESYATPLVGFHVIAFVRHTLKHTAILTQVHNGLYS